MAFQQSDDIVFILGIQRIKIYHLLVTVVTEVSCDIINPGNTTTHSGSEVTSGFTKNQGVPASHVFTTVIAYTFYNCSGSRVPYGKTFARHTVDEQVPGSGAV